MHRKVNHVLLKNYLFPILQINGNSKAYNQGIQVGDRVESINGRSTKGLPHHEALQLIRNANKTLTLQLQKA